MTPHRCKWDHNWEKLSRFCRYCRIQLRSRQRSYSSAGSSFNIPTPNRGMTDFLNSTSSYVLSNRILPSICQVIYQCSWESLEEKKRTRWPPDLSLFWELAGKGSRGSKRLLPDSYSYSFRKHDYLCQLQCFNVWIPNSESIIGSEGFQSFLERKPLKILTSVALRSEGS